jgi:carboxyl-terminal processing protease
LGIELKAGDGALDIVNVIAGSPAEEAGIQGGDRITEVNGTSVARLSTDQAADLLKGEEGTTVEVQVTAADATTRRVRLLRQRIEVPSIEDARVVDAALGIAYMRLTSFQKTTSRDMDAALWKLQREGMQTLIIDLRGNPGGLLPAAVEVADKFVSAGKIVSTRGRNSHEDFDYQAHSMGTWRVPLVLLIDGDTASASEIFAGAIRDQRRGTVIGQRSYGKGSVQGIFTLNTAGAGVRLTTAKFYSPSGQAISHRGVQPDLVVYSVKKPLIAGTSAPAAETEDAVLEAAKSYARNQLADRGEVRSR